MDAQFVTDRDGKKVAVILKIEEYERIIEQLEELDDIRSYDDALPIIKKDMQKREYKTLDQIKQELLG